MFSLSLFFKAHEGFYVPWHINSGRLRVLHLPYLHQCFMYANLTWRWVKISHHLMISVWTPPPETLRCAVRTQKDISRSPLGTENRSKEQGQCCQSFLWNFEQVISASCSFHCRAHKSDFALASVRGWRWTLSNGNSFFKVWTTPDLLEDDVEGWY